MGALERTDCDEPIEFDRKDPSFRIFFVAMMVFHAQRKGVVHDHHE